MRDRRRVCTQPRPRGHRALGTGRHASAAWGGTDGPLRDLRAVGRARTCASLPLPPFGLTCLEPPRLISELHKSDIWTGTLMYEETATERPRSGTPATFRGRVHFRPGPVPAEQSARAHTRMTSSGAPPTHTRDRGPRAGLPRSARPGLSPSPESPRRRTRRKRCRAWFRPRR